ncbi:MAG TPA: 50S ribosomal protein L10 [Candidatus Acidoferrum sp.]|nr:50S ribosomal protein L10 [Candidatus Acidoferrum sp.]
MRAEKQYISNEYVKRLRASPFFIVVDYRGLKVGPITELRKRLVKAGAEMHVVKNSLFRLAVKEAGVVDLGAALVGQLAVVSGPKDISSAAKVVKTFGAEFDKPKIKFGYLKNQRLESAEILALADLPSIEVMRGRMLGVLAGPATKLAVLLSTPGTQLARVLKGRQEKLEKQEKPAAA